MKQPYRHILRERKGVFVIASILLVSSCVLAVLTLLWLCSFFREFLLEKGVIWALVKENSTALLSLSALILWILYFFTFQKSPRTHLLISAAWGIGMVNLLRNSIPTILTIQKWKGGGVFYAIPYLVLLGAYAVLFYGSLKPFRLIVLSRIITALFAAFALLALATAAESLRLSERYLWKNLSYVCQTVAIALFYLFGFRRAPAEESAQTERVCQDGALPPE